MTRLHLGRPRMNKIKIQKHQFCCENEENVAWSRKMINQDDKNENNKTRSWRQLRKGTRQRYWEREKGLREQWKHSLLLKVLLHWEHWVAWPELIAAKRWPLIAFSSFFFASFSFSFFSRSFSCTGWHNVARSNTWLTGERLNPKSASNSVLIHSASWQLVCVCNEVQKTKA